MTASDDGRRHLARRFEVIEPNGDIEARRLAVHQLHHRDTGHFNHFERAGSVGTFR